MSIGWSKQTRIAQQARDKVAQLSRVCTTVTPCSFDAELDALSAVGLDALFVCNAAVKLRKCPSYARCEVLAPTNDRWEQSSSCVGGKRTACKGLFEVVLNLIMLSVCRQSAIWIVTASKDTFRSYQRSCQQYCVRV